MEKTCLRAGSSLGSPSEVRQALPANGADGEAPLKVVGLRGARAARAKKRTCFGRRRGAKNEKKKSLEIVAMALVVVLGILSACVIAFVNPFVSLLQIFCALPGDILAPAV